MTNKTQPNRAMIKKFEFRQFAASHDEDGCITSTWVMETPIGDFLIEHKTKSSEEKESMRLYVNGSHRVSAKDTRLSFFEKRKHLESEAHRMYEDAIFECLVQPTNQQ